MLRGLELYCPTSKKAGHCSVGLSCDIVQDRMKRGWTQGALCNTTFRNVAADVARLKLLVSHKCEKQVCSSATAAVFLGIRSMILCLLMDDQVVNPLGGPRTH